MAIDTGFYSLKEFQVAMVVESTLGTAVVASMAYVNIEGWPSVNYNPFRSLEVRHGAGRTAKAADAYVNQYGTEKRISWTGLYDQTIMPILLSNCMDVAVGTSPASYDIAYNHTGGEYKNGDTSKAVLGTYTLALIDPEGSNTFVLPGCIVDRLRIYAVQGENGGRFMYDVEWVSRYNFDPEEAAPTTPSAYASTYRTMYDLAAMQQVDGNDVDINSIDIEINSGVKFAGSGALGIPSTWRKGMPEWAVTGKIGVKHDANTAGLKTKQLDENNIVVEISNNATWASATFGLKGSYAQISEDFDNSEVNEGAFMEVPFKFMAHTSGDVIQIVP